MDAVTGVKELGLIFMKVLIVHSLTTQLINCLTEL